MKTDDNKTRHLLIMSKEVHSEMKAIAALNGSPNISAEYEKAAQEHIKRFYQERGQK